VKLKDKERCMRLSKSNEDGDRSLNKSEAASRRHGMQDGKRKKKEAWTEAVRFWNARLAKHSLACFLPLPPLSVTSR
jgi:hypothetical protein